MTRYFCDICGNEVARAGLLSSIGIEYRAQTDPPNVPGVEWITAACLACRDGLVKLWKSYVTARPTTPHEPPKRVTINLNDNIYFRLTEHGRDFVRARYAELFAGIHVYRRDELIADAARNVIERSDSGRGTQMHHFMSIFGNDIMRSGELFVDGTVMEIDL